ncbi:hypothetical protein [Pedobacter rhizosphaerae]|uniref:Uncharacterized protein n=1 Tax=Pedobacter rhizosphaerae TaxID=390241 RepID=A0A1H9JQQ2_9SPHI|nr:hypothetical protein [Pedobacter rhizosphaerae]SEQ89083.1 hypothetical protein SAMN04488023_10227 [Pedobacter rhizosphaerae]
MNFDDLKNQWDNEKAPEKSIPGHILSIKEATTPIDNIRSKMKQEFFVQIVSLLLVAFSPRVFGFSPEMKQVFLIFYAVTCGFISYYFFKFYVFYKHSYDLSLDTRKNLLWFYYEMKLNIELYKALTYIIGFIFLSFISIYLFMNQGTVLHQLVSEISTFYIVLNCFIMILVIGVITELWAKFYYGANLEKIKVILDQLEDE